MAQITVRANDSASAMEKIIKELGDDNQRRRPPSVISNFAKTCPSPPLLSVSLEFSPHRTVRHMPRHVFVYVVLYGTLLGRNRDLKRLTSGELLGFLLGAATRKVQNKSVGT